MKPFNIDCPCSPGDKIFYVQDDGGIMCLYVLQIQVVRDLNGNLMGAIDFPNYPFLTFDEARGRIFGSLQEALEYGQKS